MKKDIVSKLGKWAAVLSVICTAGCGSGTKTETAVVADSSVTVQMPLAEMTESTDVGVAESDSAAVYELIAGGRSVPFTVIDSAVVDSMVVMMEENYANLNDLQQSILTYYIFYCRNEDASEGIADAMGSAFVTDDRFYDLIMGIYGHVSTQNKTRLRSFLDGSLYFYTDTWLR